MNNNSNVMQMSEVEKLKKDPKKKDIFLKGDEGAKEKIVDILEITTMVNKLMEYLNLSTIQELEKDDNEAFIKNVLTEFSESFEKYPTVFNSLLDAKNRKLHFAKLIEVIVKLKDIQDKKKDLTTGFLEFKGKLEKEYINNNDFK